MSAALLIGNTDGIGLVLTRRLLEDGWSVAGVSRRASTIAHERYRHHVADVCAPGYADALRAACADLPGVDVCIYCAGVGEALDLARLDQERAVFETNLLGAVTTIEVVLPLMLDAGRGHIVGLSSQADGVRDPGAPSYAASKAGLSSYLEALALAVRPRGVCITNVRLGFVDTKMAKSDIKPFQMSADRAAALVLRCLATRPVRLTRPRRMALLLWAFGAVTRVRLWLS